ncbi:MAG: DGQHR domain-containing protein [Novosphingobium sp.]|nr:DGQHR domain-containing protein [Novosphingobium sp.]MCP5404273.1 DGQHR domain-containing protein [Novosphingobium sp.]
MTKEIEQGTADLEAKDRLRLSVSLVTQGDHQFYTLTMYSDVLAETCKVTTRKEDPKRGFQRTLDERRAKEIARYIDDENGTIPNSIVLSAQPEANLKIVGRGKTLEFTNTPGAFLILDGQHRVYGFSMARTRLRVPVVIYNGLSRKEETRLFIDINTKQKPVPSQLLLDIKHLADIETESEEALRNIFDRFDTDKRSALKGYMSPAEAAKNKLTRVTFNQAIKPNLSLFSGREPDEIYLILNAYILAVRSEIEKKSSEFILNKPVVFRAFMGIFKYVAQRMVDKYGGDYTPTNFQQIIAPVFQNMQIRKLEKPGTSWSKLQDYLEIRLASKLTL